ncbi:MAG TPA: PVC-type heme-binding CxxCH protein [Verrucomicrobiae bacterium]
MAVFAGLAVLQVDASELRVLFLGDNGHHRPQERFRQIQPVLRDRKIDVTYTESLEDLNRWKLAGYDALAIFANHTRISPEQEAALLEFVNEGGGLVALHCASYCFLNSDKYIELVGGQFKSHGTGTFKETLVNTQHPIMAGVKAIESWDETYVHTRHNSNRVVLAERRDDKGAEPYTWVREHGKGRVFYTAWGHDQRTWGNEDFQALVENGIRWACANSPGRLKVAAGLAPFEYMEAAGPLPNYVVSERWGTQGDPIRTMQKPLSPEESLKHLAVFPGFEKTLFVSEPEIVKPIWIAWDERGRAWIAETIDYPNEMQPLGQGRDRLKILEDTNGDGKADKFTVFAEKLSVPTGFVFANGGVIVVHSGKTEFLRDTDDDDKADERKDLFVGWGTGDTHAGPSNLRYGFDNWIWGTVGYSGFRGTVGGKEIRFGQGIFRFKPDGSALEFVRSSNNNTWGLGLSEDGTVFGSTANNNASMYMPIANRFYESVNGWSAARIESIADSQRFYPLTEKVRQVDAHGRYTAGSGSAIYTARSFPKQYWNRAQFVTEPTGHLVGMFYLRANGADYVAHNARNFAASDDEWTSPIAAEVGPDGAIWVLDWYNYIIQHNPTPQGFQNGKGNAYETPLRDKVHGRIQRIAYKDGKSSRAPRLDAKDAKTLIEGLKSDNMLWRMHAQRLIVEGKKEELIPELRKIVADKNVDELALNAPAVHALWALDGLGAIAQNKSEAATASFDGLQHPSAAVRRAAVTVLPRTSEGLKAILERKLISDSDAQVRLAALLTLSEMPTSEQVGPAIVKMLQDPAQANDRWIPDAATAAAARHDVSFLKAVFASFKPSPTAATNKESSEPSNLIANSSFEEMSGERPNGWRTVTHSGRGEFSVSEQARTGKRAVKVSSQNGADASWAARVPVKPRSDYRLTGWIKTEGVRKVGNAQGAMFNIHELQDPVRGGTKALVGDNDWTQVSLNFNSGDMREITINALFGGWGRVSGTAYFDDVQLTLAPGSELGGALGPVIRQVTTHYAQRAPSDSIMATLNDLRGASPDLAAAFLDGLVAGWPEGKAPEISDKSALSSLMNDVPETTRDRLLALTTKWGRNDLFADNFKELTSRLKQQVAESSMADAERVAAARRLVRLEDNTDTVRLLLNQLELLTPPDLAKGLLSAVTESRNSEAGNEIVERWTKLGPGARRAAVTSLMRRPEWTIALLRAVEETKIPKADIAAEQWGQLKQSQNRMISRRAERLSAAVGTADRQAIVEKLLPLAKETGDAKHGKEVFAANCVVCHVINGQGGKVGPDLTGIAARDRTDILLEILDPNRSVEANYQLWTVNTKDGETYAGRLESETQTTVEILDTAGQKHVIQRKDIASLQSSATSIMPNGFEALPPEDLKALLAFLAESGHEGAAK